MCLKELRETWVWLEILRRLDTGPTEARELVIRECEVLGAIVATSIRTARQNAEKRNVQGASSNDS